MPPDNPYAAPQTLEPRLPSAVEPSVPPARLKLAAWDTARLKELWQASRVIQDMQTIWLIMCLMMPVIGLIFSLSFGLYEFSFDFTRGCMALSLVALTFTRFGTGFSRSTFARVFALAMDGLLALFCALVTVGCIAAIMDQPAIVVILIFFLPIFLLIGYSAFYSLRALWQAPELFGPQRLAHEDLDAEIKYREQHASV